MGQCPVDVNSLLICSWATAALVQLLISALMVLEIRWHPVCMVPVLLEAPSSLTLQCCMPGKTKETVTDNKIPNGDLSGICSPYPRTCVPGELGFGHLYSLPFRLLGEHSPCSGKWQAGICPHGSPVTPWGHQAEVRCDATSELTSGYLRQKQH